MCIQDWHREGCLRCSLRILKFEPAFPTGTFKLPQLSACVSELPVARTARRQQQQQAQQALQQQLQQQPSGPGGMLGVKALRCFDIDIDWAGNRLCFHPAGHVAAGLLDVKGLRAVPCRFTKSEWHLLGIW